MTDRLPENVVPQPIIRKIINGFYTFEKDENNPFYNQYVRSWNRLLQDLEEHNVNDNRMSFYMILDAADKNGRIMFERCNSACFNIETLVKKFIDELKYYSGGIDSKQKDVVIELANIWEDTLNHYQYWASSNLTYKLYLKHDMRGVKIKHELGNMDTLIISRAKEIECRIIDLAMLYTAYLGLDNAIRYAQINGELVEYSDYSKTKPFPYRNINLLPPIYQDLENLLIYGHLVKTAVNIRFLSLNKNERHKHQRCYDIISDELRQLGFKPEEILPEEAKALSDRARRYTNDRIEELKQIARN